MRCDPFGCVHAGDARGTSKKVRGNEPADDRFFQRSFGADAAFCDTTGARFGRAAGWSQANRCPGWVVGQDHLPHAQVQRPPRRRIPLQVVARPRGPTAVRTDQPAAAQHHVDDHAVSLEPRQAASHPRLSGTAVDNGQGYGPWPWCHMHGAVTLAR